MIKIADKWISAAGALSLVPGARPQTCNVLMLDGTWISIAASANDVAAAINEALTTRPAAE